MAAGKDRDGLYLQNNGSCFEEMTKAPADDARRRQLMKKEEAETLSVCC